MTRIKVNSISNRNDNGPVNLPFGISLPSSQITVGNLSISAGVITATSFSGNGSGLTNIQVTTASKAIAFNKILSYNECYRA